LETVPYSQLTQHLIQTSDDEHPRWMNNDELDQLIIQKKLHKGSGKFMDLTYHQRDYLFLKAENKSKELRPVIPSVPTKQSIVRPLIPQLDQNKLG